MFNVLIYESAFLPAVCVKCFSQKKHFVYITLCLFSNNILYKYIKKQAFIQSITFHNHCLFLKKRFQHLNNGFMKLDFVFIKQVDNTRAHKILSTFKYFRLQQKVRIVVSLSRVYRILNQRVPKMISEMSHYIPLTRRKKTCCNVS